MAMVRLEPGVRCAAVAFDDARDAALTEQVLGEYREMTGLALTVEQAQRLWGCDGDVSAYHGPLGRAPRPSLVARASPSSGD
jgi:hypothetical protein